METSMLYSYAQLKAMLGMQDNALLSAFEQYCFDMQSNTRVLEWSCKIADGRFEGSRFLHTARSRQYSEARPALERLYATITAMGDTAAWERSLFYRLRLLAQKVGAGQALGYAEQESLDGKHSELKLYIATCQVEAVKPLIELVVPAGALPPAHTPRVMIAGSIDSAQVCRSRVYYLWSRDDLREASCAEWLKAWCSPEELWLINNSASRTVSVAFKEKRDPMLYLSIPFDQPEIDGFIADQLAPYPIAYTQIDNLRWVGVAKWAADRKPQEMNAYFTSAFLN
jgi:hypothetical protein